MPQEYGLKDLEDAAKDSLFDKHNVNIFYCSKMKHDRYIELDKVRIHIGAGLDLLGAEGLVRDEKECDISVVQIGETQRLSVPRVARKLR